MFCMFVNVIKVSYHLHPHRLSEAAFLVGLPFSSFIGPGIPDIRAQNDLLRGPPCGCGAFKFDPVSLLYLALPLAVRPAPFDTGSFSPRPTDNEGPFFLLAIKYCNTCHVR
mgnify:FL=1